MVVEQEGTVNEGVIEIIMVEDPIGGLQYIHLRILVLQRRRRRRRQRLLFTLQPPRIRLVLRLVLWTPVLALRTQPVGRGGAALPLNVTRSTTLVTLRICLLSVVVAGAATEDLHSHVANIPPSFLPVLPAIRRVVNNPSLYVLHAPLTSPLRLQRRECCAV